MSIDSIKTIENQCETDFDKTMELMQKRIDKCNNSKFSLPEFFPENDHGSGLEINRVLNNQIVENYTLLKDIKDNPEKYSDDEEIIEFYRELPHNPWNPDFIKSLNMKKYKALLRAFASKRLFGHNFPVISLKNSYICNGVYHKGEGFEQQRDLGPAINFTCERPWSEYKFGFYGGNATNGNVLFPAEVILQNFSFVRLPYETYRDDDYNETYQATTEFRIYGKETDNKEEDEKLNKIDLDLGILFLNKNQDYSDIDLAKYGDRIIYFDNEKEGETLDCKTREFLADIDFDSIDTKKLPRILSPIKVNDTYKINGYDVNLISTQK